MRQAPMASPHVTNIIEADGVFGAGGIRGLAIAGALLELAEGNNPLRVGRWHSIAGTSAGAIIAAYLAAGRTPRELLERLAGVPRPDYGRGGPVIGGLRNLLRSHGLARGERFQKWLDNELGGLTFGDVRIEDRYRLRMVAADITNRRIVVLPEDLRHYCLPGTTRLIEPDGFKASSAVRMSMAIPYLVNPVHLVDTKGRTCTIVDGGLLSGFPVWLFDVKARHAIRPTLGLRLAAPAARPPGRLARTVGWPFAMGRDLVSTGTEAWDNQMVAESVSLRTCVIRATDVAGTDFGASPAQREQLIDCGRRSARAFLEDFRLESYKNSDGQPLATDDAREEFSCIHARS
jgi:NTE family protein